MSNEEWKQIPDYPNYYVSNLGRVRSEAQRKPKELKTCDDRYGYPKVSVSRDGKRTTKNVYQLVANAFIDGYEEGLQVNHKNGNKHDNRATNLEWVTVGDNLRHAYNNGLNYGPPKKKVRIIETGNIYPSEKDCAKAINGHISGVNGCVRGRRTTYKGYHFEYADESEEGE